MESQQLFLGIVLLILFIGLLYYIFKNNIKEGFQEQNEIRQDLSKEEEEQSRYQISGPSIIDDSAKIVFGENDPITCNLRIDPKSQYCYDLENNKRWRRQLIPIHIIYDHQGKYLAVFNDGQLYKKDNLIDKKLWIGPLNNSLAYNQEGQEVGLRMIMLYPFEKEKNGNYISKEKQEVEYKVLKLIGVGVDGNLYVKDTEDYQSRWNQVMGGDNNNLIYLFTDYSDDQEDYYPKLWAIDGEGRFLEKEDYSLDSRFKVFDHIMNPVQMIKVFWDKNGFMLGIGTDFKIYKKKSTQWKTMQAWDLDNGPSEWKVNDLLLDKDGCLFGVVLDDRLGRIRLMKQIDFYYLSEFEFLELTNQQKPQILSTFDVIYHKSGFNLQLYQSYQDPEEEIYRTDNLEAIHQRNMLDNRRKLETLCKKRNPVRNLSAHNFEFENLLSEQKSKIRELSQEIMRLAHPDFSQISKVTPQGELLIK